MISDVRYSVFVSSTYEDLREERQQATQAILEAGCFPSGMELFPASDDSQWELIKRVIAESDYYIVIVAGRYGSIGRDGLSYTEMEYDYAVQQGIPVLGFVRRDSGNIPAKFSESSDRSKRKLEDFRKKVMSRTCRTYTSPTELGMAVLKSLMAEARIRPRTGWVRADQARSQEDLQRERSLLAELEEANKQIEELERRLRDRELLSDQIDPGLLAQEEDKFEIEATFTGPEKRLISEKISLTYNEIFRVIGPTMFGYIVRRTSRNYSERPKYPFEDDLEDHIRGLIIEKVQNRKIQIRSSQIDALILQFKELGLLMFQDKTEDDGKIFRGVTLTREGELKLTVLNVKTRSQDIQPARSRRNLPRKKASQ